jgi:hypothetical protein
MYENYYDDVELKFWELGSACAPCNREGYQGDPCDDSEEILQNIYKLKDSCTEEEFKQVVLGAIDQIIGVLI